MRSDDDIHVTRLLLRVDNFPMCDAPRDAYALREGRGSTELPIKYRGAPGSAPRRVPQNRKPSTIGTMYDSPNVV